MLLIESSLLSPPTRGPKRPRARIVFAAALLVAGIASHAAEIATRGNLTVRPEYFLATQVDWTVLLPAPPPVSSERQQNDVAAVIDAQTSALGTVRMEEAVKDAELTCARIAGVVGITLDAKKLPVTAAFLDKAAREGTAAVESVKQLWRRPRPYVVSAAVQRFADVHPDHEKNRREAERKKLAGEAKRRQPAEKSAVPMARRRTGGQPPPAAGLEQEEQKRQKERDATSYPSGHATFGALCGIFLTQMVPEKRDALFSRADDYGYSRLVVGAHFPEDIRAGRLLATAVAAVMQQNGRFQRDLAAARSELRMALQLTAEPLAAVKADAE